MSNQTLTQANLERILEEIARDNMGLPIAVTFTPNAVRYWLGKDGKICWELMNMSMPRASEVFQDAADTLKDAVKEVITPPTVRVVIIRKSDGQRRVVHMPFTSRAWWTEGNGACDCNRRLAFEQVADPAFCESVECNVYENEYDIELPEDMK